MISTAYNPKIELTHKAGRSEKMVTTYNLPSLIDVKGWKAQGNKLTNDKVLKIKLLEVDPEEEQRLKAEQDAKSTDGNLDVGTSINLDIKPKDEDDDKDQLGLF